MSHESETIEIELIDAVPEHANVRHYDELDEEIKNRFPDLVADDSPNCIEQNTIIAFDNCDCEIVKFTNYYHIIQSEC
jgi:hypothetical protein